MRDQELIEWLYSQLDEDERVARAATGVTWEVGPTFGARENRVYVRPEGSLIDAIGTCIITCQVASMPNYRANARHIARNDPGQVLRQVESTRLILEFAARPIVRIPPEGFSADVTIGGDGRWYCHDIDITDRWEEYAARHAEPAHPELLKALGLRYAGREGYREEWRPALRPAIASLSHGEIGKNVEVAS